MLAWLLAAALAAPPEGLDESDASPYEAAWSQLQDGPRGCWEVVGSASWHWNFGRFGYSRGDAAFVARFEDGVWRDLVQRSKGEDIQERRGPERRVYEHDEPRWVPLVGKRASAQLDEDGDGLGDQLLEVALERLGREVEFADTRWDDAKGGIVLNRVIPFEQGNLQAKMDVLFPGGALLPTSLDLTFPEVFSVPEFRLAKVYDAVARIRGRVVGGQVFPEVETTTFEVGVLGFKGSGAQTIQYRAFNPCGGGTEEALSPLLNR